MSRNPISPRKNRATAASLAALSAAPEVPPRRITSKSKFQTGKSLAVGRLEVKAKGLFQIEPGAGGGTSLRVGQGILDGQSHVRRRELRNDTSVNKLDHRMYHALGMNHNLDLIGLEIEQPARFDHLERLVHERGRVDRDLWPHLPGRVPGRLERRDVDELLCGPAAERDRRRT